MILNENAGWAIYTSGEVHLCVGGHRIVKPEVGRRC